MKALDSHNTSSMQRVFHLKAIGLLSGLGADELLPVADIASETSLAAGETVFEQGAQADKLYLIAEGKVEVVCDGQPIATLGENECCT